MGTDNATSLGSEELLILTASASAEDVVVDVGRYENSTRTDGRTDKPTTERATDNDGELRHPPNELDRSFSVEDDDHYINRLWPTSSFASSLPPRHSG